MIAVKKAFATMKALFVNALKAIKAKIAIKKFALMIVL